MIDLRSDTVTKPSDGMRRAMAAAEVGDDVYGEDPTANRLEAHVAALLGKEAALFVPTGVMANQLGIKVHTRPGDEVIVERQSHIYNYESAAPAVLAGVQLAVADGTGGLLTPAQVEAAIRPGHYWEPQPALVCLENTANKAGGVVYPLRRIEAVAEVARAHGLRLHLDGARLWNAPPATGTSVKDFAAPFDTAWVAFSKALGAPVGSALAGSEEMIREARRWRKLFGGGMRQVGVLAAAALYALEHHVEAIPHDHEKARRLAEGLAATSAFRIDPAHVATNIVMFDVAEDISDGAAQPVVEALAGDGVLVSAFGPQTIRATTHRDVSMEQIDEALSRIQQRYG